MHLSCTGSLAHRPWQPALANGMIIFEQAKTFITAVGSDRGRLESHLHPCPWMVCRVNTDQHPVVIRPGTDRARRYFTFARESPQTLFRLDPAPINLTTPTSFVEPTQHVQLGA